MGNLPKIILGIFVIIVLICLLFFAKRILPYSAGGNLFNERYGSLDAKQNFDFYAPSQESDILIIVVHGGAWVAGDKSYMAGVASYLNAKGYPVINMNYRLAPKWKYDTQLKDIALMINYAHTHSQELKLKQNFRIVLIGHSAGGQLVEMYGLRESKYGTENIWKIVALAGPSDLVNIEASRLRNLLAVLILDEHTTKQDASPLFNITPNDQTKFLLIVGSEDELVEERQVNDFETELKKNNIYVESLIVQGRTHNTIFSEIPDNDVVAQKILSFIAG